MIALNGFYIDPYEITAHTYACVRYWANQRGYDLRPGTNSGREAVGNVNWYDCVKCCNALSELAGKTPVYYTDPMHQTVYRNGEIDLSDNCILATANGYALPTSEQWEYACRAGTSTRYYWGDEPDFGPNYQYAHQWYAPLRNQRGVFPVATLKPNAFGLYDMSGNVAEWCWDWYIKDAYRVIRGGSVALDSNVESGFTAFCRPQFYLYETGFRVTAQENAPSPIELTKNMTPLYELPKKPVWDKNKIAETLRKMASYPDRPDTDCYLNCAVRESMKHFAQADFSKDFQVFLQGDPDQLLTLPDQLPWIAFDENGKRLPSDSCSLETLKTLVKAWVEQNDSKYLNKWFALMKSYLVAGRWSYDILTPQQRGYHADFPLNWFWGQGYDVSRRGRAILSAMAVIAKHASADEIPSDIWCGLLVLLGGMQTDVGIRDGREAIPNQALSGAKSLLMLQNVMPEFHHAPHWLRLGLDRFCSAAGGRTMLADGSDMEQSFNYNQGLCKESAEIYEWLKQISPETAQEIIAKGLRRKRFLRSMETPVGGVPASGSASQIYPPYDMNQEYRTRMLQMMEQNAEYYPDPMYDRIKNNLWGDRTLPPPAFTSIAFPYGGYYIFRDGWKNDSLFGFFMGARVGFGHCCDNSNALDLTAYGRLLLCSGGASYYGSMDFVPASQREIIEQIEAYRFSAFGHNTLSVDGYSQRRHIYGENFIRPAYQNPIPARFFPSDILEFAEGFYQDGYGDHTTEIQVSHHRMVFFLKQEKLWIVIDETKSDTPHKYTLSWGFPPRNFYTTFNPEATSHTVPAAGFAPEEIQIDAQKQMIYTQDPRGANVFLYQFGPSHTYTRYCGALAPARGWLAPAIRGERYPKTDVHVSWEGTNTRMITVIAPSKDCSHPILDVKRTAVGVTLALQNGAPISLETKNGIRLRCQDYQMVISSQDSYFDQNHCKQPIRIPETFRWENQRPCYW